MNLFAEIEVAEAGAGLQDEGEGEFVGWDVVLEHEGEGGHCLALQSGRVSVASNEGVEEEGVVGGWKDERGAREGDREGVVEGLERGGGGGELGEDEGVGLEA